MDAVDAHGNIIKQTMQIAPVALRNQTMSSLVPPIDIVRPRMFDDHVISMMEHEDSGCGIATHQESDKQIGSF